MKVYANKLKQQISSKLHPAYVISGDEPMQLNECCDWVRKKARLEGYLERTIFSVDIDTKPQDFLQSSDNMSLFAELQIIEVRLPKGKVSKEWAAALNTFLTKFPPDTLLIVSGAKLERGVMSSAWYKKADKVGVTTTVWPLKGHEMQAWITRRIRELKLKASRSAVGLIAQRVEGNMLAAEQEIGKLEHLFPKEEITDKHVISSVANSSRYSIFDLTDAALEGNVVRSTRILFALKGEGVVDVLVLWSMSQEVTRINEVMQLQARGISLDQAIASAKIPRMRIALLKKAIHRQSPNSAAKMLSHCAFLDRLLKGRETGDFWQEQLNLILMISGIQIFKS